MEAKELNRTQFKTEYIDGFKARAHLWHIANTRRDVAAAMVERWLPSKLPSESLWEWAFFNAEVTTKDTAKQWGCCYWNLANACNPTNAKTHPAERHHCYICGSGEHGAVGTLTHVQDNECPAITDYRAVVSTLAGQVGVKFRTLVEFIGFGRTPPLTIWVRIAKPAPNLVVKSSDPAAAANAGDVPRIRLAETASTLSSPQALRDPELAAVLADDLENRLFERIRAILPQMYVPAGATKEQPASHNKKLFSFGDGHGGPRVFWCECNACKKSGEYRHPVFHGAYVPRQHNSTMIEPTPLRIVVKTFGGELKLYNRELMTYEQLGLCVPRPCTPLVMHGTHRRKGLIDAGENDEHPESRYFIAVLHRDMSLSEFLRGYSNDLSKCLRVARGLVQAVAQCHGANVIHRDLKPGNVLVHDAHGKCQVELIDFEGTHISHFQSTAQSVDTRLWAPPTIATVDISSEHVALRGEAWTLGMLLYEILRNATCKIDIEKDTPGRTAEQEANQKRWMTTLSTRTTTSRCRICR
jgi:hypothetical protein